MFMLSFGFLLFPDLLSARANREGNKERKRRTIEVSVEEMRKKREMVLRFEEYTSDGQHMAVPVTNVDKGAGKKLVSLQQFWPCS